MPPTSYSTLLQDALGLISRAFGSIGTMFELVFTAFLNASPLPDEVDFFLFFIIIGWLIVAIWRWIRDWLRLFG
jgi:hypothetical protein